MQNCARNSWRLILGIGLAFAPILAVALDGKIGRQALVTRHNPVIRDVDPDATLTVGNGGFAFGADITGLQTFAEHYHRWGVPTETQSRWCWVTDPNPNKFKLADASRDFTNAAGRIVSLPTKQSSPAGDWLRKNPRSHPLGQILLDYVKADGSQLKPEDIQKPEQPKLDQLFNDGGFEILHMERAIGLATGIKRDLLAAAAVFINIPGVDAVSRWTGTEDLVFKIRKNLFETLTFVARKPRT
jgi:hypothetical protein